MKAKLSTEAVASLTLGEWAMASRTGCKPGSHLVGPLVRIRWKILGNHARQLPHSADMNCKAFFRIELATALAPGVRVSSVLLADIAMLHHFFAHFWTVA